MRKVKQGSTDPFAILASGMYAHELKDKPVQTILLDEQLVVARLGTEVCAFADICAHRGTPLSLGTIENCELRCAYHGWQYNNEGNAPSFLRNLNSPAGLTRA